MGGRDVAHRLQAAGDLVLVPRPDLVVHGQPLQLVCPRPRFAGGGDEATTEGLVLGRREHHRRDVVLRAPLLGARRNRREAVEISVPTELIGVQRGVEARIEGGLGSVRGVVLGRPEAEGQGQVLGVTHAGQPGLPDRHDVSAVRRRVVDVVEEVVRAQVAPPVATAEVAAARPGETVRREHRAALHAVGGQQATRCGTPGVVVGVQAQTDVVQHVDLVGLSVEGLELHVDEHGGAGRVSGVGLGDPVPAARRGVDLPVDQGARVDQLDLVLGGLVLPIGEGRSVRDDELGVAGARRVDPRGVHLAEDAVVERVPDRAVQRADRRAEAVLVAGRPVRRLARITRGDRPRLRLGGDDNPGDEREESQCGHGARRPAATRRIPRGSTPLPVAGHVSAEHCVPPPAVRGAMTAPLRASSRRPGRPSVMRVTPVYVRP